jgi:chromosome partitioning protein
MTQEHSLGACGLRVIVVANEKGGTGKSTVAMNLAIALMGAGQSVSTIDLDTRQRTLTHYIDNRLGWARTRDIELMTPTHICFDEDNEFGASDESAGCAALAEILDKASSNHAFVVVDTAGHSNYLARFAHSRADALITPLNDSFLDLDVLATLDPDNFSIVNLSQYAQMVQSVREARRLAGGDLTWLVLRNRLSMLSSRNKRHVGQAIGELARMLDFRFVEGLAERVVYREYFLRGLTAFDQIKEMILGTRPTMSHVAAQLEMQSLIGALLPAITSRMETPDRQATAA